MKRHLLQFLLILTTLLPMYAARAYEVQTGIDPEAQLPYWELHNSHMSLRLIQRMPDQTRAFFQARGFTPDNTELIARSCVFQTVFKNTSNQSIPSPLEYNLNDWTVRHNNTAGKMKMREDWKREWIAREVPIAAQLAFEWALYPTWQIYQPGDYNWGMSIFNLKPGSVFDLEVVWQQSGKHHSTIIRDLKCAPDEYLAPRGVQ